MADCDKCIHLPVWGKLIYCSVNGKVVCDHYLKRKQATSDENKRWIPVSDRLPEDEEKVLALSKSSWSDGYLTWLIRYNHKKSAFYDYDAEWGDIKIHNVTHWMPLPEPPKEV